MSTQTQLPHLNNLPQWSRVNTLDKARYPKPFLKDRLQPLTLPSQANGDLIKSDSMDSDTSLESNHTNPKQQIHHLEKSLRFLRQQHHDVLTNLHDEIEGLKKENKDLHFKVIMTQRNGGIPDIATIKLAQGGPAVIIPPPEQPNDAQTAATVVNNATVGPPQHLDVPFKTEKELTSLSLKSRTQDGSVISQDTNLDELKHIFYEEEIKELRQELRDQKQQNAYMTQLLEQEQKVRSGTNQAAAPSSSLASTDIHRMSTNPLQVHPPQQAPRPPTLQECEVIIRHLQNINEKQSHELNRLKSDLRDVLYSHKWTPDAYLLAKAYIAEDDAKVDSALPKLQLKHGSATKKMPNVAFVQREAVTLPALTQTMGSKAVERRKRTQILQKARLRKEVNH